MVFLRIRVGSCQILPNIMERRRKGLVHTDMGVEEVNLTIRQGEFVFVVGASGSGKSTLLRLITGEIRPNEGRVYPKTWNLFPNRKEASACARPSS